MDLETRISNLENLVNGLIANMNNSTFYTDADISGIRSSISSMTSDIKDNSDAIFDIADTIESLDERVTALEEAQNG